MYVDDCVTCAYVCISANSNPRLHDAPVPARVFVISPFLGRVWSCATGASVRTCVKLCQYSCRVHGRQNTCGKMSGSMHGGRMGGTALLGNYGAISRKASGTLKGVCVCRYVRDRDLAGVSGRQKQRTRTSRPCVPTRVSCIQGGEGQCWEVGGVNDAWIVREPCHSVAVRATGPAGPIRVSESVLILHTSTHTTSRSGCQPR